MIRRVLMLVVLLAAGCGEQEYEVLLWGPVGDDDTYVCPSGETITVPRYNITNPTPGGQAAACLGIAPTQCVSELASDGAVAGDSRCDDPTFNPLLGTCVELFFLCFTPAGECSGTSGSIQWASGHRSVTPEYVSNGGGLYPPGADEPCILWNDVSGADLLQDDGTETQFLKPL